MTRGDSKEEGKKLRHSVKSNRSTKSGTELEAGASLCLLMVGVDTAWTPLVSQACRPARTCLPQTFWSLHPFKLQPQLFFSCVTQCICVWVNLGKSLNGVFLQKLFGGLNLKNIFFSCSSFPFPSEHVK